MATVDLRPSPNNKGPQLPSGRIDTPCSVRPRDMPARLGRVFAEGTGPLDVD